MQEQSYHSIRIPYTADNPSAETLLVRGTGYYHHLNNNPPVLVKKHYWRLQLMDHVPEEHNEPELMRPRQFTIYRAAEPYIQNIGTGCATGYYWIHFTGNAVEQVVAEAGLVPGTVYTLQEAQMPLLRRSFERLFREFILREPGWNNMAVSQLLAILTHLGRGIREENGSTTNQNLRTLLNRVVVYMHYHYSENITIPQLGRQINLTERRFRKLFHDAYGISPSEYLINLRLTNAQQLLQDSSLSIAEVAEACGYADPLYFSRLFHKKIGVSPLAYRKGKRAKLL